MISGRALPGRVILGIGLLAAALASATETHAQEREPLLFGIYLGAPELGERIFSAVRMFPVDHPEALGHEYPTASRFHRREVDILLRLGETVGLDLYATLMRHPAYPADDWPYEDFAPPPQALLSSRDTVLVSAPAPGVRVAAYLDGTPLAFLIDTRDLTLEQRGMSRPTSSGLDIGREEFVGAFYRTGEELPSGAWIVVFGDE